MFPGMKSYNVVFIDWNGTLSTSKFWGHLEKSGPNEKKLFEKIEKTLFGKLRHLLKPWMRGELRSEEVINQMCRKSNLDYKKVMDEFIKGCEQMEFVTDNCIKKIGQIRDKGTKVVIATDNMDSFIRWTVPKMKLDSIFDKILDSSSIKALKNDFSSSGQSLFFDKYFQKNKLLRGDCLLIDDSEDKENKIQTYGIDYLQIDAEVGIEPALDKILLEMSVKTTS